MTAHENFISRWARLKRVSDSGGKTEHDAEGLRRETPVSSNAEPGSAQDDNLSAGELFDPASLPSIEAITVDTDIRASLQSRVPAELTRAALRQTWVSDPVIRDFIGIAENQWDFNDPNAIQGFGPLRGTDNVPALLEQALGRSNELAEAFAEIPLPVEQAPFPATDHDPGDIDRTNVRSASNENSAEGAAIEVDRAEEKDSPVKGRSHGAALPR
jgi:Protein of unknown function (DUF3306)